jgi:hypothetical protein
MNDRSRWAFGMILLVLTTGPFQVRVFGQGPNDDSMKTRILELEAENAALRELLGEIRALVASTPKVDKPTTQPSTRFRLFVESGEWGSSSVADIKKVCESAAMMFTPHLKSGVSAPLLIQNDGSGPITLYRRGGNNEHIVRLDTKNRAWAQLAFQFSHELCHVMCNYRDVVNQQLWFEETLCEVASLFALRQMGEAWKTDAPYSNWKSYSVALNDYAAQRLNAQHSDTATLEEVYRDNLSQLQATATNRDVNNKLARKLLPIFEKRPSAWEAVRYLNRGPAKENLTFEGYLRGWHSRLPETQKEAVEEIAAGFGVVL